MIGSEYTSFAVQAVIGAGHSSVIPDVLWGGWMDAGMVVLGYSGVRVPHESFGPVTDGVANITPIDGGVAGASWAPAHFGLFDAKTGGNLVASAAATMDAPATGQALIADVGDLVFTYEAPGA